MIYDEYIKLSGELLTDAVILCKSSGDTLPAGNTLHEADAEAAGLEYYPNRAIRMLCEDYEKKGASGVDTVLPTALEDIPAFLCPISEEVMTDPVVAADGYCYERAIIEEWIEYSGSSPFTREMIREQPLVPNRLLIEVKQALSTQDASVASTQPVLQRTPQQCVADFLLKQCAKVHQIVNDTTFTTTEVVCGDSQSGRAFHFFGGGDVSSQQVTGSEEQPALPAESDASETDVSQANRTL